MPAIYHVQGYSSCILKASPWWLFQMRKQVPKVTKLGRETELCLGSEISNLILSTQLWTSGPVPCLCSELIQDTEW